MKHRNSHLLVGYWSRMRKGRDVPDQTDIDPRSLKRMLSHVFILEASDASRPVYRLAGTSLCEQFGSELRGTNFLAHWESQSRGALCVLLKQALLMKQPVSINSIASIGDYGMIELETVLAPITFGDGRPTRFLGMVQILSDVAHFPGRAIAFQRLVGSQIVREDEPLSTFDVPPPPMPPMEPAIRTHPRAPHLRLVVSRDRPAAAAHMDSAMREFVEALDSLTRPVLQLV